MTVHESDLEAAQYRLYIIGRALKDPVKALTTLRSIEQRLQVKWPDQVATFIRQIEVACSAPQLLNREKTGLMRLGLRRIADHLPMILSGGIVWDSTFEAKLVSDDVLAKLGAKTDRMRAEAKAAEEAARAVEKGGYVEEVAEEVVAEEGEEEHAEEEEEVYAEEAEEEDLVINNDEEDRDRRRSSASNGASFAASSESSRFEILIALADDLSSSRRDIHRRAVGLLYELAEREESGAEVELADLADYLKTKVPGGVLPSDKRVVDVAVEVIRTLSAAPTGPDRDALARLAALVAGPMLAQGPATQRHIDDVARAAVNVVHAIFQTIDEDAADEEVDEEVVESDETRAVVEQAGISAAVVEFTRAGEPVVVPIGPTLVDEPGEAIPSSAESSNTALKEER